MKIYDTVTFYCPECKEIILCSNSFHWQYICGCGKKWQSSPPKESSGKIEAVMEINGVERKWKQIT